MRKVNLISLLLAVIILALSACAQKTCPTYTKEKGAGSEQVTQDS